jgi:hypothetical protein
MKRKEEILVRMIDEWELKGIEDRILGRDKTNNDVLYLSGLIN